jgi:CRP/FNR family transcriptional regulator, cyclic AMP receptor protein
VEFPAGSIIFREGDPGDEMFVIERGRVQLLVGSGGHEQTVAVLGPGDFFGELSLLGGARRTATAVASENAALLPIRRDVFAMMMQDDLELVFRMMDGLGKRLRQTDQHVHGLASTLARARAAADLLRRFLAAGGQTVNLDPEDLARGWDTAMDTVMTRLSDLTREGALTRRDGRWLIETPAQATRLAELIAHPDA